MNIFEAETNYNFGLFSFLGDIVDIEADIWSLWLVSDLQILQTTVFNA